MHSEDLFEKALAICRQFKEDYQSSATLANILYGLGQLAFVRGEHSQALPIKEIHWSFSRGGDVYRNGHVSRGSSYPLRINPEIGKSREVVRCCGLVSPRVTSRNHVDQGEYEHWLAKARKECGEPTFSRAWAEGLEIDFKKAMVLAVEEIA